MTISENTGRTPILLYSLVFFGGFANLAAEIIGPRMFASSFGSTTVVWAVMISVTLVGLSVGYALGGRIPSDKAAARLPWILIANALYLIAVSWLVWEIPASAVASGVRPDTYLILTTAVAAFFVPSVLFGMVSPIAITLIAAERPPEDTSRIVGNVYALGTIGSVTGALAAAFVLIPWVGLSTSLQVFAAGLVAFAAYFWTRERAPILIGVLALVVLFPQPDLLWQDTAEREVLAQRESRYQSIRVLREEDRYLTMHLGPTFQSRVDLQTGEPAFSYADTLLAYVDTLGDLSERQALVIGGAGHALAHTLEGRGMRVTEVEIDPLVVELSDEFFGPIEGDVVIQDGRVYLENTEPGRFDLIVIDAFNDAANVPPQLTTLEFFQAVRRALNDEGLMVFNFIGTPEGPRSRSFMAMAATLNRAFDSVAGASTLQGDDSRNIILAASPSAAVMAALEAEPLPDTGVVLTDERNPIEIFLGEARDFTYFRR